MTLNVRVLEPGIAEAQDVKAGIVEDVESGGHQPADVAPINVDIPQQPVDDTISEDTEMVQMGSAAHETIEIGSLLDTRLRLQVTLKIDIEKEGEFYIAKCEDLNEFGYGFDPIQGVQDLRNSIAELYWNLKEYQDHLGTDLSGTWLKLGEWVREV